MQDETAEPAVISIARNGSDWIVVQNDALVSVHPTREEAERCAFWLVKTLGAHFEPVPGRRERRGPGGSLI
jgi:hypothetical protein